MFHPSFGLSAKFCRRSLTQRSTSTSEEESSVQQEISCLVSHPFRGDRYSSGLCRHSDQQSQRYRHCNCQLQHQCRSPGAQLRPCCCQSEHGLNQHSYPHRSLHKRLGEHDHPWPRHECRFRLHRRCSSTPRSQWNRELPELWPLLGCGIPDPLGEYFCYRSGLHRHRHHRHCHRICIHSGHNTIIQQERVCLWSPSKKEN